jgi:hypothetical protein
MKYRILLEMHFENNSSRETIARMLIVTANNRQHAVDKANGYKDRFVGENHPTYCGFHLTFMEDFETVRI